jgi:hypothetical protein
MEPKVAVDAQRLVGSLLSDVTASWHLFDGEPSDLPVGLWLTFSGVGSVEVTTAGDGSLGLFEVSPPESFDMDELGSIVVERLPEAICLTALIGARVERVIALTDATLGYRCGIVLGFPVSAAGVANVGDDIWCLPWPDPRWSRICVEAR